MKVTSADAPALVLENKIAPCGPSSSQITVADFSFEITAPNSDGVKNIFYPFLGTKENPPVTIISENKSPY